MKRRLLPLCGLLVVGGACDPAYHVRVQQSLGAVTVVRLLGFSIGCLTRHRGDRPEARGQPSREV